MQTRLERVKKDKTNQKSCAVCVFIAKFIPQVIILILA